jgi:hypothetical protein
MANIFFMVYLYLHIVKSKSMSWLLKEPSTINLQVIKSQLISQLEKCEKIVFY